MNILIQLALFASLSITAHAGEPAGVGQFLASTLARINNCAPSARIESACARHWAKAPKVAEGAARMFQTQLIRAEHFANEHPELAHSAFNQALDQILTVYGLRFPSQADRNALEETEVLMAYTAENIERFWQTLGIMWRSDPTASDPKYWLGRLVAAAGYPRLTIACEDRLVPKLPQ